MATTISLEDCQLQVWRSNSSSKCLSLSGVELSFPLDGGTVTVKQFSDLSPTNSFVAYKLETSNCTYTSTEYLSADVRILCLRLEEPVPATICIDEHTNPEAIADEIATLQLCPMADTTLALGCKIDLIIPRESQHTISIARLLEVFGRGAKEEKRSSSQLQFPTVIHEDRSQSASITLSNDDLDYLEASTKPSQVAVTNPKPNPGRYDQYRGPKRDQHPRQRRACPLPFESTEGPDSPRNIQGERALVDNWAKQKEMWVQLSKPKAREKESRARPPTFDLTADADEISKTEWISFAASHASPGDAQNTTTAREVWSFGNLVPGPRKTGGYLQDSSQNYDRPDSQQLSFRSAATYRGYGGRGRGRGRFKAASFIPPTNASWTTRPEPNW